MKFTVQQIADVIGAQIEGDPSVEITTLSKIEEGKTGSVTFLANPKYLPFIYSTEASAVIVPEDFKPSGKIEAVLLRVKDPYSAFTILLGKAQEAIQNKSGIHPNATISPSAKIAEDVYIGAGAYIGDKAVVGKGSRIYPNACIGDHVTVGEAVTIYSNVTIYYGCRIGNRSTIHANTVIGSDGFGFAPQQNGTFSKIPQTGIVEIGEDVEIGAGCTIDRATLGATKISNGVKIDNLVQIAHNVEIGENTVIAAQTGISGSTRLGKNCMVGGQVGIVGHIQLADGTRIGAQSGVSKTVKESGGALRGSPAQEYRKQLKTEALLRNLDEMYQKITYLEKILSEQDK